MKIRLYEPTDKAACMNIINSNLETYFMESEVADFENWLDNKIDNDYWVVEEKGKVIGCGGIYKDLPNNVVGLSWGMVHQDEHGEGYGSALTFFRVSKILKDYPTQQILMHTSQHTYKFYEKMGFLVKKITPNGFGENLDRYDMEYDYEPA